MMDTTETTVITPMITPSSVRKLRSLCVLSAAAAIRMVSKLPLLRPFLLLLFHLRSVLDLAQRAERAGDDLLAFLQAGRDLDVRFAGEAGRHGYELHGAAVIDEHAFFILRLAAGDARLFADDERLQRNGNRLRARAGDDVGR